MTNDHARQDAEQATTTGVSAALTRVMEQVGLNAGARAAFGEAIERDGRTVIPVAQVIVGSGGGAGDSGGQDRGSGFGGGAITRPQGFIEIDRAGARFVPLRQPWRDAGLVATYAVLGLLVLRVVLRSLRGGR